MQILSSSAKHTESYTQKTNFISRKYFVFAVERSMFVKTYHALNSIQNLFQFN
jgi:hypothetical protein